MKFKMSRLQYDILVYGMAGTVATSIIKISIWQFFLIGLFILVVDILGFFLFGEEVNTSERLEELERKARLYDAVKRRAYITFNEAAHRTNAGGSREKFVVQFPVCIECNDLGCFCDKHLTSEASQNLDDAIEAWIKSNS